MKILLTALVFSLTTALFSIEQDSRPVATAVAVEAKYVKTQTEKTVIAKFTRTITPTPKATATASPTPGKATPTPTLSYTPVKP